MRRSFFVCLWLLAGCLFFLWQQPDISGDEPATPIEESSDETPPPEDSPAEDATESDLFLPEPTPFAVERPGVLVMRSLELVEGIIQLKNGAYHVQTNGGNLIVPKANVQFECGSREEAYLLLKPRVVPNNPSDHISLAKWCARNELFEEARDEIQAAIRLNPGNTENKLLLKEVEQLLDPYRTPGDVDGTRPDRFDFSSAMLQRVEPLGGMTRNQAREFTSRVQPILLNGCATAHCHREGNREQLSFKLHPLSRYQSNSITKQNYDRILTQIDRDHPERSPLLTAHRDPTDGILSPFEKPQGKQLEQAVLNWIVSLDSGEKEAEIPAEAGSPKTANIISTINRDRNRHERRRQLALKRRELLEKRKITAAPQEDFLSDLLSEETANAAAD